MKLFNVIDTSFERFDNTVRIYLQKTLASLGINYTNNQIFGVIFNVLKGVMQNAMVYIEDALTEQNIFTAVRKKSVYNLAKLSGYEPYYGQAATGTIRCTTIVSNGRTVSDAPDDFLSSKIYIKNNTQVRNTYTGLVYTLFMPTDEYVIDVAKPLVTHEFKVVEGTWNVAQYTAVGKPFESFSVGVNGMFDRNYIEVYVNGQKWEEISGSVYDMESEDEGYYIIPGYDALFDVCFGNGVYGKALVEGDTVIIKYIAHNGTQGNTKQTDADAFIFDTGLYNSFGELVDASEYINIKQKDTISGGTNADTIQQVKNAIGGNSRSLVYITPENFKMFLRRFSFVGWCNVFCSTESSLDVTGCCLYNINIKLQNSQDKGLSLNEYYNINKSDLILSDTEKQMIIDTLNNSGKLYTGINFSLIDPLIRRYASICYIKLKDSTVSRDVIKNKIMNIFAEYFLQVFNSSSVPSHRSNVDTGLYISKSEIITRVMNACSDTVSSFDFDFISEMKEQAFKTGYYIKYKQVSGKYIQTVCPYQTTEGTEPGLDSFGNILLESDFEVPLFQGGFTYYTDKENNNKNQSVMLNDAVQIYFI